MRSFSLVTFVAVAVSSAWAAPVLGPILNGATGLPNLEPILSNNTYDYIVVGAGTSGFALAARLSENGKNSVAVIEAGQDIQDNLKSQEFSQTPGGDVVGCGSDDSDFVQNDVDWGFHTQPQTGANNRIIRYARGKASGGSSTRNFMIYQRPTVGSMAVWQQLTGDSSWGFAQRFNDFKKSMTFTPPKHNLRQESPAAQYNPADFGSTAASAPLQVSYPNLPQNFSNYNEVGTQTTQSFNDGSLLGVQYNSATIDPSNGHRSTSRYFYAPAQNRANLKVFFETMAKKVILTKGADGTPTASAVTYSTAPGGLGTTGVLYANKEVIVSAGAFHSPQLLMVSGIGPKDQLANNNITQVVVNENVGKGMQDHIFAVGNTFEVKPETHTFTDLAANPVYLAQQLANYTENVLGPLTNHVADLLAWEKLNASTLASLGPQAAAKLSAYPADWPIIESFSAPGVVANFANLLAENAQAGADGSRYATILQALVAPQSRGTVTLASADTATLPVIDPGWLTDPVDQKVAIYALKRARQVFATSSMSQCLMPNTPEYLPGPDVQTDDQILNYARNTLMTVWHASCTCSMRKKELGGVLDSQLRVYGVNALRVVDASSFPMLPPGHPQSTLYMLAERAATLIQGY